jgi:hypothetical protein
VIRVLALDLEGTLISSAVSQFARPGLREFLEWAHETFERVVLFTSVPEQRVRSIVRTLVDEGEAPPEANGFECIAWTGSKKDLRFIPGAAVDEVLLVDDQERCVEPEQRVQWVAVREWEAPYEADDELVVVRAAIEVRVRSARQRILALDLQGTLISNAVNQFPRPGLHAFLAWALKAFDRVVLFTSVRREVAIGVLRALVREGDAPPEAMAIEYVDWPRSGRKDLRFITNALPDDIVIIDDKEEYILPEHRERWLRIASWTEPAAADEELTRIRRELSERLARRTAR